MDAIQDLSAIPKGLREPLLNEYRSITRNYAEHRWSPSELSGGPFCEIVYSILDGFAKSAYSKKPSKPRDFVGACRKLGSNTGVPRSFQILIPRALPAMYEVRNNRGVGHVGGDVDPNHMDATLVVSMANWTMAELVRVFHNFSIDDAQALVDNLAERRIPLVWHGSNVKRVLNPAMALKDQILLLISSGAGKVSINDLLDWCEYKNRVYFRRIVRELHYKRLVELSKDASFVELLPPGFVYVSNLLKALRDKQ